MIHSGTLRNDDDGTFSSFGAVDHGKLREGNEIPAIPLRYLSPGFPRRRLSKGIKAISGS